MAEYQLNFINYQINANSIYQELSIACIIYNIFHHCDLVFVLVFSLLCNQLLKIKIIQTTVYRPKTQYNLSDVTAGFRACISNIVANLFNAITAFKSQFLL